MSDTGLVLRADSQLGLHRLIARLGAGGMGEVWLAEHVELGRQVAIKVLHARHLGSKVMHERFCREARLANRVRHPNIVEITELAFLPDGRPYMVMELIEGEGLHAVWRRGLDRWAFLEVATQIAGALEAAHQAGVVHRDIKPENLFVGERTDGSLEIKIIDFGVARVVDDHDDRLTRTGEVVATASYMSPEQATGEPVDARSDVYSLGVVLWELLVGRRPFCGRSFGEYVLLHATRAPEPPSRAGACMLRGGVTPEIDAIVLRCLAKRPEQRFDSAADLRAALEALREPRRERRYARPAALATAAALSLAIAVWLARSPAEVLAGSAPVKKIASTAARRAPAAKPIASVAFEPDIIEATPEPTFEPDVIARPAERERPRARKPVARKAPRADEPFSSNLLKNPFGGAP